MAKLVDAPDLGSGVLRRVGSSPITRTMRQKRNFTTKKFLFFCCKIDNASSKRSREAPQNVVPRGLRKASVVNFHFTPFSFLKIDNTCSNRSQDAWRSHALRVAVGKCCQLRQTKSTTRAARGHAKHRRMWCRVGCEKQVLSILLSESTMPTAVGQTKYGQSSYRLGRDKAVLSITANKINNTCSNRSIAAPQNVVLQLTTLAYRNPRGCRAVY